MDFVVALDEFVIVEQAANNYKWEKAAMVVGIYGPNFLLGATVFPIRRIHDGNRGFPLRVAGSRPSKTERNEGKMLRRHTRATKVI